MNKIATISDNRFDINYTEIDLKSYTIIELERQLKDLEAEHQELDESLNDPEIHKELSDVLIQRLKKRKLLLKDHMERIRLYLYPELIV